MIARALIFAIGAAFLAGAIAAWRSAPVPVGLWLAGIGTVLVIGGAFENMAGGFSQRRPGAGWVETDERFVDEKSGKVVTVFYKPATGDRLYYRGD